MNTRKYKIVPGLKSGMENFRTLFCEGVKLIQQAAKQYAEDLEKYPEDADIAYTEAFPNLMAKDWRILRKIGRGELVPRAFLLQNEYAIKCLEVFPVAVQRSLVGDIGIAPVPQKVMSRGKIVEKTFDQMSASELNTVVDFKTGRMRSSEEQIKIACRRSEPPVEREAWRIINGTLCVYSRTNFSIEDVADILRQMREVK